MKHREMVIKPVESCNPGEFALCAHCEKPVVLVFGQTPNSKGNLIKDHAEHKRKADSAACPAGFYNPNRIADMLIAKVWRWFI